MVMLIVVLPTTIVPAQSTTKFRNTSCSRTKLSTKNGTVASIDRFTNNRTSDQRYGSISKSTTLLKESTFSGHHTSYSTKYNELQHRVQKIREMMMTSKVRGCVEMEELIMVDVIQQLGLEDYFKEEIHVILARLHANFCTSEIGDDKLYEVALCFRLLRQHGYHVSADIFNKFKGKEGKFKLELCEDVKALLSLFESSQLRTSEEDILGEACDFSRKLLKASLRNNNVEQSKAQIIENTLRNPYHKNLARLLAKNFVHNCDVSVKFLHDLNSVEDEWMNEIHKLAQIDFYMMQSTCRSEMQHISRWAKELNLDTELSFTRIEPFKWCMWSLGIFPGQNLSEERIQLAKAVSFVYIIDDIFDSFGTYDDHCLFMEAINRWENADINRLPNCMKVCFKTLLDTTSKFTSKIQAKHGWDPKECLRKLWTEQCEAYLNESKWRTAKYSPSPEEYLNNGIVTSGTHVVLAHAYFLLGQEINDKSLEELNRFPSIISATAKVLRLWNDVGMHTDRTPHGNDGSYLHWYMEEQNIRSSESARRNVSRMISDAWKRLNKEYMSPMSPFSKAFRVACLNLARIVPLMYNQEKSHHLQFLVELSNSQYLTKI